MITDPKPYPGMKPSGVEWLGDVPEHWERRKLRQILTPVSERNRPELPLLSVVRERGVILRNVDSREENHNVVPDDLTNYKVVQVGHFAMNKMKAWQGSYGVSRLHGLVSPAYFVFELNSVRSDFFHTAIRSRAYVPSFIQASDGVRIGQWDLSQEQMKETPFFIPSPDEQTAIVRYLDHADRRISRYIRAKQRLIELLEEEKQAIIHRAVTRGLDLDVPLKPSGVDWLGDVPEHWEVRRLVTSVQGCINGIWGSEPNGHQDLPCVRVADFDRVRFRVGLAEPTMRAIAPSERNRRLLQSGDLLLEKSGGGDSQPVGVVMLYDHDVEAVCSNFVARMPVAANCDSSFLTYLHSHLYAIRLNVRSIKQTTGIQNIDSSSYLSEPVAFPPFGEQAAIARYLDQATANIDAAIDTARREIGLLREYRTRLIADVVTGKLDVREAAAELPEVDPADLEDTIEIDDVVVVANELDAELEEVAT